MAVSSASQTIEAETPLFFPADPQRTISDAEYKDAPYLVGTGVGMNPRIEPMRHGFEFDLW